MTRAVPRADPLSVALVLEGMCPTDQEPLTRLAENATSRARYGWCYRCGRGFSASVIGGTLRLTTTTPGETLNPGLGGPGGRTTRRRA